MAPKTSTFFDLKTCLGKSYRHSRIKGAKQTLARLPHPAASSTINSAPLAPAPLGNIHPFSGAYRIPAGIALLLQTAHVLLACILAPLRLSHPLSKQPNCFTITYAFFYLDAAWLNEGRCPGGRLSVSKN